MNNLYNVDGPVLDKHFNCYKLYLTIMQGDADYYDHETIYIPYSEEKKVAELEDFLRNVVAKTFERTGMGGDDCFTEDNTPGWNKWFGDDGDYSWCSNEWGGDGDFEDLKITYINAEGREYDVSRV